MEIKDLNNAISLPGKRVFCIINKQVCDCYVCSVDASSSTEDSRGMNFEVKVVRRDVSCREIPCCLDRIFWTLEEASEHLQEMLNGKPTFSDCIDAEIAICKAGLALGGYRDERVKDIVARLKVILDEVKQFTKQ